jgi:hypothetical protein
VNCSLNGVDSAFAFAGLLTVIVWQLITRL